MPNYIRPVVDPNYLVAQMSQLHLQSSSGHVPPVLSSHTAAGGLPAE